MFAVCNACTAFMIGCCCYCLLLYFNAVMTVRVALWTIKARTC
jgi:hypothetical protein